MDIFFQLNRISDVVNKTQQQYILGKQPVEHLLQNLLDNILPLIGCQYATLGILPTIQTEWKPQYISTQAKWLQAEPTTLQSLFQFAKQQNKPIFTEDLLQNSALSSLFQKNEYIKTLSVILLRAEDRIQGFLILGNFDQDDEFDLIALLKPVVLATAIIIEDHFNKMVQKTNFVAQDLLLNTQVDSQEQKLQGEQVFYLNSIFNASDQSILVLDTQGKILYLNDKAIQEVHTYQQKTIAVGHFIHDILLKDVKDSFQNNFQQACQGEAVNVVVELAILSNKKTWYEVEYLPIKDKQGQVQAVAITALDITKNKKIETALRETYHEINNFKNALYASALIIVTDLQGFIIDINTLACQVTGYEKSEILSQPIQILESGYHEPQFFKDMWATLKKGKSWRGEIKHQTQNKQFFWTDTVINPVFNEQEEVYQYLWVNYTITERKLAEEQQQKLLRDLYNFAFETSHGLRKPLANILGLASVFDTQNLANEFNRTVIEKIQESSEELDAIVLKMNKMLSGKNLKF